MLEAVQVLTLERVPFCPEVRDDSRVAELTGMGIQRAGAIDFSELALHLRKSATHPCRLGVGQALDSALVDWPRGRKTEICSRLGNVDGVHVETVRILHGGGSAIVNSHGAFRQTVLFLQFGVHQIKRLAELRWTVFERLLEQVSRSLELLAAVSTDKLGQVDVPDLEGDWEVEELDSAFVHLVSKLESPGIAGGFHNVQLTLNDSSKYLFSSRNPA